MATIRCSTGWLVRSNANGQNELDSRLRGTGQQSRLSASWHHSTVTASRKPRPSLLASASSEPRLCSRIGRRNRDPSLSTSSSGPVRPPRLPRPPRSSPAPVDTSQDLLGFILSGALVKKTGLTEEGVRAQLGEWQQLSSALEKQLGFDESQLSESQRIRIFHYYLPVFFWCRQQLEQHRRQQQAAGAAAVPPLTIGISAPQGCGKTTVVESLEYLFHLTNVRAASISIDDFYLTNADQRALAASNPDNKLLELRGNAGSHDLALGSLTLESLKQLTSPGLTVKLPRYDKSAFAGRGDRADPSVWPQAEGPLDVVLFEGWMLGFEPVEAQQAEGIDPQLATVNRILSEYDTWHQQVDSWIIIAVEDVSCVYKWRLQAEVQMRAKGKAGMTDEQVADFVSRYMPAYQAYLPALYAKGPKGAKPEATLVIKIDSSRNPLE